MPCSFLKAGMFSAVVRAINLVALFRPILFPAIFTGLLGKSMPVLLGKFLCISLSGSFFISVPGLFIPASIRAKSLTGTSRPERRSADNTGLFKEFVSLLFLRISALTHTLIPAASTLFRTILLRWPYRPVLFTAELANLFRVRMTFV